MQIHPNSNSCPNPCNGNGGVGSGLECEGEKKCGEFEFCAPAQLHFVAPEGEYTIYKITEGERCAVGGIVPNLELQPCEREPLRFPEAGEYVIEWCVCDDQPEPEFNKLPLNGIAPYHADFYYEDAVTEDLVTNGDGTITWAIPVKCFHEFMLDIPPCCEFLVSHSGTTNGALRLKALLKNTRRVYTARFDSTISDLEITGTEECLQRLYLQVKRG